MKVCSIITAGQNTMRWARRCRAPVLAFLWAVGAIAPLPAARAEGAAGPAEMEICFDYACAHQASARFDATLLDRIRLDLGSARDAAHERSLIAAAAAQLYVEASRQTPIWRDRGGNRNDNTDLAGAMDCLDHSANTTAFLRLMEQRGMLRFHRAGEPARRVRYLVAEHWSARIVARANAQEYVVDSWFFDLGTPAVVMPLAAWRAGEEPLAIQVSRP